MKTLIYLIITAFLSPCFCSSPQSKAKVDPQLEMQEYLDMGVKCLDLSKEWINKAENTGDEAEYYEYTYNAKACLESSVLYMGKYYKLYEAETLKTRNKK
jgi:hypothetical protein